MMMGVEARKKGTFFELNNGGKSDKKGFSFTSAYQISVFLLDCCLDGEASKVDGALALFFQGGLDKKKLK